MNYRLSSIKTTLKGFHFIIICILLTTSIILLTFFISATAINSTTYSGYFTQGISNGNVTNISFSGEGSGFYQQPVGNLNDTSYSGQYAFTSQIATPSGLIIKPKNKTYIKGTNLKLNFTLDSSVNYIWYNLDNEANTTITGNTTFTTTNGLHTLYLFVNNSEETTSKSLTFTVDTTKLIVHYSNYSGSTKGESTDFNESTYEELQNLSGIIIENTNYGKIAFNEAINLTNDSISSDNDIALDTYIEVLNNSIIINSTALPNFNKSATLYLYNLSFTNPRVLRDGSACPSTICAEINYSGGTFVFNVTQFSNYSADETPGEETPTTTTSGGGGGGGTIITPLFTLDRNQISVTLIPGQVKTEEIIITNTGTQAATFRIDNLFLDFVARGEDVIVLNQGESRVIPLYILARIDIVPNLYLGKIIISSGNVKREILIAIEVESDGVLLDVRAEILQGYDKILPGGEVLAEMRLFNLGSDSERKDVLMEYIIKDYDNNTFASQSETLAIETQTTFIKRINIPENAALGNYVLYVKAIYDGKTASSSDNFEIVSSTVSDREKIYIVTIILLSIIIGLIIYYRISRKEKKKGVARISLRAITRK